MRQNLPVVQDNWEIDSQISLDTLNGGNNVEVESNDLESQVSEATEDLMRGEDEDDEDITDKLKELNLAVNYDTNTNGKYWLAWIVSNGRKNGYWTEWGPM